MAMCYGDVVYDDLSDDKILWIFFSFAFVLKIYTLRLVDDVADVFP